MHHDPDGQQHSYRELPSCLVYTKGNIRKDILRLYYVAYRLIQISGAVALYLSTNRADCQWFAIGLQWVRVRSASDPRLNIQGLAQGYYFKLPEGRKVAIEAAVHTEKFSSGLMSPRGDHFSLSRLQGNSEVAPCLCAESLMYIYSWISHTVMRRMCGGPGTRLLPTFAATTIVTLALTKQ